MRQPADRQQLHTAAMDPSPVPLPYGVRIHLFLLLLGQESKRDVPIAPPLAYCIFLDVSCSMRSCSSSFALPHVRCAVVPLYIFLMERVACERLAGALLTRDVVLLEIVSMLCEAAARMRDAPPFYAWTRRTVRRHAMVRSRRPIHCTLELWVRHLAARRHGGHSPPCSSRSRDREELLGGARAGAAVNRDAALVLMPSLSRRHLR